MKQYLPEHGHRLHAAVARLKKSNRMFREPLPPNPYTPSSQTQQDSSSPTSSGIQSRISAWLITSFALLSHAGLLGIALIARLVPGSWIATILLALLFSSLLFSLVGTTLIRRSIPARVLCGLSLLVSLAYISVIAWFILTFELPGQD